MYSEVFLSTCKLYKSVLEQGLGEEEKEKVFKWCHLTCIQVINIMLTSSWTVGPKPVGRNDILP